MFVLFGIIYHNKGLKHLFLLLLMGCVPKTPKEGTILLQVFFSEGCFLIRFHDFRF